MRESKTGDRHRKLTAEKITQKRAEGENQMSTQVDAKIQAAVIRIRWPDVGCGPIFLMNMTMNVKITCETLMNSSAVPLLPMQ
jgi:hypothetical protein